MQQSDMQGLDNYEGRSSNYCGLDYSIIRNILFHKNVVTTQKDVY